MFPVIYVHAEQNLFLWWKRFGHLSRKSKSEQSCINILGFWCQKPSNFKTILPLSRLVAIHGLFITWEDVQRKLYCVFIVQWSLLSQKHQGKFDSVWYDQCSALLMFLPRRWKKLSGQKAKICKWKLEISWIRAKWIIRISTGVWTHCNIHWFFFPVWNFEELWNMQWTEQRFHIHSSTCHSFFSFFFCDFLCDFYKMLRFSLFQKDKTEKLQ